ncbi:MAG: Omp28-related outer membrane protein [Flavobacteriales bacterium]|jgi:hypothetical protein
MKNIFIFSSIIAFAIFSCDKVDNAYPAQTYTGGLDPTLYPGNITDYVVPTFSPNTNTNRNVLIEDFTGHTCIFCPDAAAEAHNLETANPGRVFTSTLHTGPTYNVLPNSFQSTSSPYFEYDFTNSVSSQIGGFFGELPGNGFTGNPSGNVSRFESTSGQISSDKNEWANKATSIISANDLRVKLQALVNYFPSTNGAFIHIEVEPVIPITNELRVVVAFYEDSIVKPQKDWQLGDIQDYVHRDLLKFHVNGDMFGQKIDNEYLNTNGKYYYDYSLKIPADYTAENSHLLIYVFDKVTNEIYQVIKKKFI